MTYKQRFVAVVKSNGKILRERDDTVFLPFGSEYSILLKNLESKKASVKISIDGKDVLGSGELIMEPNSELELERFVESLDCGNRFKFIQKTNEIVEHRGDRIDDGIIRIEFRFEKEKIIRDVIINEYHYDIHPWKRYCWPTYWNDVTFSSNVGFSQENMVVGASIGSSTGGKGSSAGSINTCNFVNDSNPNVDLLPDEGITVKGSESKQKFSYGYIGELESASNVIIIKLRGNDSKGEEVKKPITVKTKLVCETCGRSSDSISKFCPNCGTALN
jgi:hypothetical protein